MKTIPLFAASALALSTSLLTIVAAPSTAQGVRNSTEAPPSEEPNRRGRRNREAAPAPTGNPAVSRAFITALTPVNTAITAQDWVGADTGLTALKAAAVSPYELYLASHAEYRMAVGAHNSGRQLTAIDAMIESDGAPATERATVFLGAGQLAFNADQFAKAAQRFEAAAAAGSTFADLPLFRLVALFRSNQLEAGLTFANELMAAGTATDQIYGLAANALREAGREPEVTSMLIRRLALYPTQINVRSTISSYLQNATQERGQLIDLLRLMHRSGAMNERRFYNEHISNLVESGQPAEAIAMIASGRAAGVIPAGDAYFAEIESSQRLKLADDRASLPGQERRAAAAPDGRLARLTADAYFGYENYGKAEELYQLALSKSPDESDLINTRLGITRFSSGDFAGALEAFSLVTAGERGTIARMWEAITRGRIAEAAAAANPPATPATPVPPTPPAGS